MNNIEQLRATSVQEQIETYQLLKMVLQRMARNKKYTKEVRSGAMKELDATRAIIQSLVNQRDQAQTAISTERSTAPAVLTEADASQVQTRRLV
jgi:hypothetical protein